MDPKSESVKPAGKPEPHKGEGSSTTRSRAIEMLILSIDGDGDETRIGKLNGPIIDKIGMVMACMLVISKGADMVEHWKVDRRRVVVHQGYHCSAADLRNVTSKMILRNVGMMTVSCINDEGALRAAVQVAVRSNTKLIGTTVFDDDSRSEEALAPLVLEYYEKARKCGLWGIMIPQSILKSVSGKLTPGGPKLMVTDVVPTDYFAAGRYVPLTVAEAVELGADYVVVSAEIIFKSAKSEIETLGKIEKEIEDILFAREAVQSEVVSQNGSGHVVSEQPAAANN